MKQLLIVGVLGSAGYGVIVFAHSRLVPKIDLNCGPPTGPHRTIKPDRLPIKVDLSYRDLLAGIEDISSGKSKGSRSHGRTSKKESNPLFKRTSSAAMGHRRDGKLNLTTKVSKGKFLSSPGHRPRQGTRGR